jgi:hypothetical protein
LIIALQCCDGLYLKAYIYIFSQVGVNVSDNID